jgi:integrase/recombinase XerD
MIGRKSTSLDDCIDHYLAMLKLESRSETTRQNYARVLHRLARRFKNAPVQRLRQDALRAYLGELVDTDICPASFNFYAIVIRAFFAWLVEQGEIRRNPLADLRIHGVPDEPVMPFSDEEIKRLFAAADTPLKRLTLLLLLDCGLRAAELCGLQLSDVNLELGEIRVLGKGRKVRHLALNPAPRQALVEYLLSGAANDGSLWPAGWSRARLRHLLREMAEEAGVSHCHPHRFRHTFAMLALKGGIGELALKVLLGHSSLVMVERYVKALEGERALEVHRAHPVA